MSRLLRSHDALHWADACDSVLAGIHRRDPRDVVSVILGWFGGMGSLNDLVLMKFGVPLVDENDRLGSLTDELHRLCHQIRTGEMLLAPRNVAGSVVNLRCQRCKCRFPHFIFEGETDAITFGLVSASSCSHNEVVLGEMAEEELRDFEAGLQGFEQRLSVRFGRPDFRVVKLLRAETTDGPLRGLSFQDFRRRYRTPRLVYACPCCRQGEAHVISEMTVETFEEGGGRLLVTGGLRVVRAASGGN